MNNHNYDSNQDRIHGHLQIVNAQSSSGHSSPSGHSLPSAQSLPTAQSPPSVQSSALQLHIDSNRVQPSDYIRPQPYPRMQIPQHRHREYITVHDHDVLCGRGVNIAHHAGNERFRSLITTYHDESYCTSYSASEKRAVAAEIIRHITALDPPGRFLKRLGKGQNSRGLHGPWQLLSEKESIKKTCQALRDCNRADRSGYAQGVSRPHDVLLMAEKVSATGLTAKQRATVAAANAATEVARAAQRAASESLKRKKPEIYSNAHINGNVQSPQIKSHAVVTTHSLSAGPSPHGLAHIYTHSPSNFVHSPLNQVTQLTSPSVVGSAPNVDGFPHSSIPSQSTLQQNYNHCYTAVHGPYMNQVSIIQQHQNPRQSYIPFTANTVSQYSPQMQHQSHPPLPLILSTTNQFTPYSAALNSGINHDYNSSPIKKQRSTDDTEPSTVSGSSTTSTPLDACNNPNSNMVYSHGSVPFNTPEIGALSMSCHFNSIPGVGQEADLGDAASTGDVGLFQIKEDEADADTNVSKNSWDNGAEDAESDGDQYGGSLHSF